jgi:23S rRNA (guanosine2251-2'-O)-methyltransferase
MTENAARRLETALAARSIEVERVTPRDLDRRLGADTVHQGALVEADPLPDVDLSVLLSDADAWTGPIVVLDQVTDPHNVGAVLRSAAVFGARGLVMTRRHSPPLAGALAKAASGALDQVPIALVQNLAVALTAIRESGAAVVGLDGDATVPLEEVPFKEPAAIVLGAEGKGLRELTRERCTRLVRIGASGPLKNLNVSNAAAIALYFAAYRRRFAG